MIHSHRLDQYLTLSEKAELYLEVHRTNLEMQGVEVYKVIKDGEPEKQILDEIENNDYGLVAMAIHGHKFISDLLFSSAL